MTIRLDCSLTSIVPQFKIGIIHYTKIVATQSPQMILGRTRLYQESLFFDLQDAPVTSKAGVAAWRDVWKQLGANASRYRHSTESMLRRIAKGDYLTPVNSVVDLNNFFSLQYEIPVGSYDVQTLRGDITVALGNEHTQYEALNGRSVTLQNIPYTSDSLGPFGSPYVDSKRSAVSEGATDVLQVFYLRPSMERSEANELLTAAGNMFTQINGGSFSHFVLSAEQPTHTL
ncbi:B3/B4 domain-containing protein [Kurthia senegalensis]|uniref:B3/B4 domain-containing protein n=1 Tax=Kurthia senegalensis TaxID=1033740 RepID=UPI000289F4B7|nr:phenylalanine--tRNA ligase beta subunit-related protein [Kurthia senegalensis]